MKGIIVAALSLTLATVAAADSGVALVKGTTPESKVSGTVTFHDMKGGLHVSVQLTGLTPGDHAFHIHEFGSCEDVGKAAGSHYNPLSSPHGFLPKDGMHKAHSGDMGNILAAADGSASLEVMLPRVTLAEGKYTVAGRAVIVHEKKDDFSQPVGNAGGRVGCGIIVITGGK